MWKPIEMIDTSKNNTQIYSIRPDDFQSNVRLQRLVTNMTQKPYDLNAHLS